MPTEFGRRVRELSGGQTQTRYNRNTFSACIQRRAVRADNQA